MKIFSYFSHLSYSLRKSFRRKKDKPDNQGSGAPGEIDSITDAYEVNAILNQLREDERQSELKRINQSIDANETRVKSPSSSTSSATSSHSQQQKPAHRAPPPPSRFTRGESSGSIDEDEMLNSIIGNDSTDTADNKRPVEVSSGISLFIFIKVQRKKVIYGKVIFFSFRRVKSFYFCLFVIKFLFILFIFFANFLICVVIST